MKITQDTLRKIIREELEEAYKSGAQRDKELNAEIRMIKKDPEFITKAKKSSTMKLPPCVISLSGALHGTE